MVAAPAVVRGANATRPRRGAPRAGAAVGADRTGWSSHETALRSAVGGGFVFMGRDFVHWRPCCLGEGEDVLVLLLHYVREHFPTVACETRIGGDTPGSAPGLVHDCAPLASTREGSCDDRASDDRGEEASRSVPPAAGSVPPAAGSVPPAAGSVPPAAGSAPPAAGSVDKGRHGVDGGSSRAATDEPGEPPAAAPQAVVGPCDPSAFAWSGPLHEIELSSVAAARAAAADRSNERFLLYSSCVQGAEPGYCMGQFNNQLHLLHHALAVSRRMERVSVPGE